MYIEKLTINGTRYTITHNDDGSVEADKPLPDELVRKFDKNIKGIAKSGKFPGLQTDTAFHAGRGDLIKQNGGDEAWTKFCAKRAKKRGAVISSGHTYISQLAREPGDPEAYIPPGEGRKYIEKLCKKRGMSVEGSVNYQAPKPVDDKPKGPRLAEDLVQNQMWRYRTEGKVDKSVSNKELRKMVIEKHGRKA